MPSKEIADQPGLGIARIWRGRTTSERADEYQAYLYEHGIRPLEAKARTVQLFREDRELETEFVTISYWDSIEAMSSFAGPDPTRIHHLPRDAEFLMELPSGVQILRVLSNPGGDPSLHRLDHIDLRVRSLAEVRKFYLALLPALGFSGDKSDETWFQFEAATPSRAGQFFGITESKLHLPNENRIAFWAESNREVDRLAEVARNAGARNIEGPGYDEGPGYYAVFFEDPGGNRLEICHRVPPKEKAGE